MGYETTRTVPVQSVLQRPNFSSLYFDSGLVSVSICDVFFYYIYLFFCGRFKNKVFGCSRAIPLISWKTDQ